MALGLEDPTLPERIASFPLHYSLPIPRNDDVSNNGYSPTRTLLDCLNIEGFGALAMSASWRRGGGMVPMAIGSEEALFCLVPMTYRDWLLSSSKEESNSLPGSRAINEVKGTGTLKDATVVPPASRRQIWTNYFLLNIPNHDIRHGFCDIAVRIFISAYRCPPTQ